MNTLVMDVLERPRDPHTELLSERCKGKSREFTRRFTNDPIAMITTECQRRTCTPRSDEHITM